MRRGCRIHAKNMTNFNKNLIEFKVKPYNNTINKDKYKANK